MDSYSIKCKCLDIASRHLSENAAADPVHAYGLGAGRGRSPVSADSIVQYAERLQELFICKEAPAKRKLK